MKTIKINTFGVDLDYLVPESVEEFDKLAGREGAALDEAIKNIVYRSALATIRDVSLHGDEELGIEGLEAQTGIERLKEQTGEKKNEDGTTEPTYKWGEAEAKFFKRICATKGVEAVAYADHLQNVANNVPFDPSRPERVAAGPKVVAKTFTKLAQKIVDDGRGEASAAKLAAMLGHEVEATVESLARAIAENERKERAALASKY